MGEWHTGVEASSSPLGGTMRVFLHAFVAAALAGGPFFVSLVLYRPNDYWGFVIHLGAYLVPSALAFGWLVCRIRACRFRAGVVVLAYLGFAFYWVFMVTTGIVWIQESLFGIVVRVPA